MRNRLLIGSLVLAVSAVSCAGAAVVESPEASPGQQVDAAPARQIELVTPSEAAGIIGSTPGAVVLDVRTPEEFAAGHLEGATNIDFYAADFADQIAELDRDVPYVVYCRSGNRSGSATELMDSLGFSTVFDVDGGILSWVESGTPTGGF